MVDVMIMMSTYNGETYLEEQIESILSQQDVNVRLLIRDDGSSDGTLDILEKYSVYDNITWYKGTNLGSAMSFIDLLFHEKECCDYYAFCDQDDIWDPDKMIRAIGMIPETQDPVMYHSRKRVVDAQNVFVRYSGHYDVQKGLCALAAQNYVTGCTMVFNRALYESLLKYRPQIVIMHDNWIRDVCLAISGRVVFDQESRISYRQHGKNVIGAEKTLQRRIKKMIRDFQLNRGKQKAVWSELLKGYGHLMNAEDKKILNLCINYNRSLADSLKMMMHPRIISGTMVGMMKVLAYCLLRIY